MVTVLKSELFVSTFDKAEETLITTEGVEGRSTFKDDAVTDNCCVLKSADELLIMIVSYITLFVERPSFASDSKTPGTDSKCLKLVDNCKFVWWGNTGLSEDADKHTKTDGEDI